MAWNDLKSAVAAVIKTNGNQEITGGLLQSTLNSIIDQVGANATFKGIASVATAPGVPDGPQFYLASGEGNYPNFGITLGYGESAVFLHNGSTWTKQQIPFTKFQIDNQINSLKNNVFNPEAIRKGLMVTSPNGNIAPYPSGLSAVTYPIPIPKGSTKLYLFSDQFVVHTCANLSFRNDIGDGPATYGFINVNGSPISIPVGYKYVVVTIARNDTPGAVLDTTNIKIGFNTNYANDYLNSNLIDPASFTPKMEEYTRFLSKDFPCFRMYKNSKTDQSWSLSGFGTIKASTYYRSILSMELSGFDKTKPHKLSMVRRNFAGNQDYSIIISEWSGSEWVRAAYWIKTGVDIEASNPGGIILYEATVSGKTIKAYIDYSFIPDATSTFIGGSETTEPNFIIKQECFKEEPPYLIESDVYAPDNMYYEDRLKMLEPGNNKFNPLNAVIGTYINSTTGAKYSTTPEYVAISEDIPVPEGATHVVTQGFLTNSSYTYPSLVCCMDANKNLIGGASLGYSYIATLLPGTKYIAVPLYRNVNPVLNPDWSDTLIAFSDVQIPYEPYKLVVKPEYLNIPDTGNLTNRITTVESEVLQIKESMSLYEKNDAIIDLPVSVDGSEIKTGYAYIEQGTNILKVK